MLLLAACSRYAVSETATPTVAPLGPVPRTDAGTFCLYRPSYAGFPFNPKVAVFDNGQLVGATSAYGYFCWLAEPGAHRVTLGQGAIDRVFRIRRGERFQLVQQTFPQDIVPVTEADATELVSE